ncbi:LysR family transcriptional regulator [Rhodobacter sp. CZR27]|uniref:LysR family transcriptional regulator n=1 Tax=Rhodobacter sp. CZR27 TaxID=2033869 RepID=UPI000BBEDF8A|nr:LysR family transcriptional regulator [Rhodobacter sp. CZR27]
MKRGTLPLTALRAFEATMRLGQMRRAADELGVTYSAVSRQVRGLEEMLGVPLFEGPRNRLVPSAAALALQPALTEAFDGIEAAVARVQRRDRRVLDVSCLGTLAMRWLIPRMALFQAAHPGIELRLTTDDGPVDFTQRRIDVAIRVGSGPWGSAQATELFPDNVGPVLSPALIPEDQLTPQSLLGMTALKTRTRPAAWADWTARQGLAAPIQTLEFEHFYFMLEAVTAGLGVAIAPDILIRDDLAAGRLVAPFGFVPSGMSYVALRPARRNADAETFIDWLVAAN